MIQLRNAKNARLKRLLYAIGDSKMRFQRALLLNAKRLAESSATHRRRILWGGHGAEAPALRGAASATPHYGELTISLLAPRD
jgi:hypothetical protein